MNMETGVAVSGTAHAALILWVIIGGSFLAPTPDAEVEFTEISLVSEADIVAWASTAPETSEIADVTTPPPPETAGTASPENDAGVVREKTLEVAVAEPDRPPKARPKHPRLPEPDIDAPPDAPDEPNADPGATLIDTPSPGGAPRLAPRVAPVPTLTPPDTAVSDPAPSLATRPEEAPPEHPVERQIEKAPEESARQIVTEAEDTSEDLQTATALTRSRRPVARPPDLTASPDNPSETAPRNIDTAAALAETFAEEIAAASTRAADTPLGPSLSGGYQEAIRSAVGQCWNVGALSAAASRTKVTLRFSMAEDGRPVNGTIQLVSSEGGDERAVNAAFQTARRALLRCADRFALPADQYGFWRDMEMTFNPDAMRIR